MNTNLIHNILNALIVLQGALIGGLMDSGCVSSAPGVLDCSASFISPSIVAYAMAATAGLKIAINIGRDGLGGLFKAQPPVK